MPWNEQFSECPVRGKLNQFEHFWGHYAVRPHVQGAAAQGCACLAEIASELTKTCSSGTTEFEV